MGSDSSPYNSTFFFFIWNLFGYKKIKNKKLCNDEKRNISIDLLFLFHLLTGTH